MLFGSRGPEPRYAICREPSGPTQNDLLSLTTDLPTPDWREKRGYRLFHESGFQAKYHSPGNVDRAPHKTFILSSRSPGIYLRMSCGPGCLTSSDPFRT